MTIFHSDIRVGDIFARLAEIPDESIDCVVTSPPYWGLRNYGVEGQLGLEPTLAEHIETVVRYCAEIHRVLKPSGTFWLNYGDCYATAPNGRSAADTKALSDDDRTFRDKPFSTVQGSLKPKDLCMVPNRIAIALQEGLRVGPIKSDLDAAWLAGLIDGDGCIGIRRQDNGKWNPTFIPYLTIAMTDRNALERCVEITGLGKVNLKRKAQGVHKRDFWVWRLDGQIASKVIRDVYPFLIVKSLQAKVCNAMNVSQATARTSRSKPVPEDVVAYRDRLYTSIKSLNQRCDIDLPRLPEVQPNLSPKWWVRSEIVWAKPNPMPESIKDRPATSHEKIFLLTKSGQYDYIPDAVRQGLASSSVARLSQDVTTQKGSQRAHAGTKSNGAMKALMPSRMRGHERQHEGFASRWDQMTKAEQRANGRSLRNYEPAPSQPSVWKIATRPFKDAHFATFPPELAERCILAGCPEGGTVLDPFGGAGTTGLVAQRHGRRSILIELNPDYAEIARTRLAADLSSLDGERMRSANADHAPMPLFAEAAS